MIRLPKLFNRNTKPEPVGRVPVGSRSRASSKSGGASSAYQRSSQTQSADDPALTEDPDRQRARHRLIGAAVLVLIAVVGLPRLLDGNPKTVSNDIAVNIVTSLPLVGAVVSSSPANTPPVTTPVMTPPAPSALAETPPTQAATESATETKPPPVYAPITVAPAKNLGLAAGEEVVKPSSSALADNAIPEVKTSGTKFVIQIGAFASEERAKGWIAKLKEQKIPNYVLNRTSADGTKLFVLRAGPFTDKDAAEAAEKKIKAMGLSPRLVEVGKA